jgi:ABC-type antimicrobial peptide transport system permease subunit
MGIFGACGLLIAIIGLYGLLAYNVSRSRRDIAVRLALGATRSSVIGLVVRHAMLVLGIGLIIGFAVWNQTATLLRSYLYGIGWHDALTLTSVGLTFLLFALIASYVPARQASLVDPMNSLRSE